MLCRAGWLVPLSHLSINLIPQKEEQVNCRQAAWAGCPSSASVIEVFIRVGHERRALKIFYKDGEQYSETDDLDLVLKGGRHPSGNQAPLHC